MVALEQPTKCGSFGKFFSAPFGGNRRGKREPTAPGKLVKSMLAVILEMMRIVKNYATSEARRRFQNNAQGPKNA